MRSTLAFTALLVAAAASRALAGTITIQSLFGPSTFTTAAPSDGNHAKGTADATVTAGGTGLRNCISHLDAAADVYPATLRVLDGGTTIYQLVLSSGAAFSARWAQDSSALCGSANTALSVKVTTGSIGGYNANYQGFTY